MVEFQVNTQITIILEIIENKPQHQFLRITSITAASYWKFNFLILSAIHPAWILSLNFWNWLSKEDE